MNAMIQQFIKNVTFTCKIAESGYNSVVWEVAGSQEETVNIVSCTWSICTVYTFSSMRSSLNSLTNQLPSLACIITVARKINEKMI